MRRTQEIRSQEQDQGDTGDAHTGEDGAGEEELEPELGLGCR
jgi:hypothetical protein